MRQKAVIPVEVPPIQPAGVLHDFPTSTHMRFEHPIEAIREGARVRIWGGCDVQPRWLPEDGGRAGVLGTVVRFLAISGSVGREAVIHIDRPLVFDGAIGDFVVLRLRDSLARWTSGETVSVELCEMEPNVRFLRRRDKGVIVETTAVCELL